MATIDNQELSALRNGAQRLVRMSVRKRRELLRGCVTGVEATWRRWVADAWEAKQISPGAGARAEDILTGPVATVRYLQLLDRTLADIEKQGEPILPGEPVASASGLRVPVFPTKSLYDRLLFGPFAAHVRMPAGVTKQSLFGENVARVSGESLDEPCVAVVLGAGNVSAIPITDALTKIFQNNQSVLLKMNPVNQYVGHVCEKAFSPLIDADLLRIVYGDGAVGSEYIASHHIDCVHVTGSDRTHDAIVWGRTPEERAQRKASNTPLLEKPITSELGNVSPWIIVPGLYSQKELHFQAENVVASVTNNASFNCIATKMLITSRDWPQREQFLDIVEGILAAQPRRYAYYPGAADRFARFAGHVPESDQLPWTMLRDVDPVESQHLFREESFVCVFGETSLSAESAMAFLSAAVDFANEQMWGTLSAALTVPREFAKRKSAALDLAIERLRYGIVGINQWPGVAFALMSTPWGAYPGSTLHDVQSGIGSVHNTFMLDRPEKTVLSSPLTIFPKPIWFSTHRRPEAVATSLTDLYMHPSIWRLPSVLSSALFG